MISFPILTAAVLFGLLLMPLPGRAQHADHAAHHGARATDSAAAARVAAPLGAATLPGQDAFAAVAEIVELLRRDPSTDWSRVNVERLRQHLIDMHEVTLHAAVVATPVPRGVQLTVTGRGRTRDAIRRMLAAHTPMLEGEGLQGAAVAVPGGMRWTVTARDLARVAEVRALGLAGILALGNHHTVHHLQLARGDQPTGHH